MENGPKINKYDTKNNSFYKSKTNINIYIPKTGISIPKDSDYDRGYFYRYFYQLANDKKSMVYEIKEDEYNFLQKEFLYKTLKIKWKLIGNMDSAREINSKIINVSDSVLHGIKSVLIDPLQFWKNLPDIIKQFDVSNKLPRVQLKKKRYDIDLVSVVAFDERGLIYILTQDFNIIFTEDFVGILAQL